MVGITPRYSIHIYGCIVQLFSFIKLAGFDTSRAAVFRHAS